jgi:hypothetical protein
MPRLSRNAAITARWDEISFIDAATRNRPQAEADLIWRLVEHASVSGATCIWSQGARPRVSSWYPIAKTRVAVWNLSADIGREACLYFYLPELAKRVPAVTLEHACLVLQRIPALTDKVVTARAVNWQRCPAVSLPDVIAAPAGLDTIFRAINTLVGETRAGDCA